MIEQLNDLLEDREEVDMSVAAGILKRVVRIDRSTAELRPMGEFDFLSGAGKVAALALGYRAAVALAKRDAGGVKAGDLVSWSGMPRGTIARELAKFANERLLLKKARGSYDIPAHAVQKLATLIKDELDGTRA